VASRRSRRSNPSRGALLKRISRRTCSVTRAIAGYTSLRSEGCGAGCDFRAVFYGKHPFSRAVLDGARVRYRLAAVLREILNPDCLPRNVERHALSAFPREAIPSIPAIISTLGFFPACSPRNVAGDDARAQTPLGSRISDDDPSCFSFFFITLSKVSLRSDRRSFANRHALRSSRSDYGN